VLPDIESQESFGSKQCTLLGNRINNRLFRKIKQRFSARKRNSSCEEAQE
jgi:hypothetical protein